MADVTAELAVLLEIRDALTSLDTLKRKTEDTEKKTVSSLDKIKAQFKSAFDLKQVVSSAVGFLTAGGIMGALNGIKGALSEGVDAALAQEKAMGNLRSALSKAGGAGKAAEEDFVAFADAMERNTLLGDDQVISALALAKSFGATNKQAKQLVEAANDLAIATGKELEPTIRILGKTLSGTLGPLDEMIPGTENLTAAQLAQGEAIRVVTERYGGQGRQQDNLLGTTNKLTDAYGNFLETFGEVIVKSDSAKGLLGLLAERIDEVTAALQRLGEEQPDVKIDDAYKAAQRTLRDEARAEADAEGGFWGKLLWGDNFRDILARKQTEFATEATAATKRIGEDISNAALESMVASGILIDKEQAALLERLASAEAEAAEKRRKAGVAAAEKQAKDQAEAVRRFNAMGPPIDRKEAINNVKDQQYEEQLPGMVERFNEMGPPVDRDEAAANVAWQEQVAKFEQAGAGLGDAFLSSLSQGDGKAAAKSFFQAGGAAVAEAFAPGLGKVVGPVLGKLMEGPEATKQFIREFIEAIPEIMVAVAEAMPAVVEAFVDVMVNRGGAERIAIAMIKVFSGATTLEYIGKGIGKQIGVSFGDNLQLGNLRNTINLAFEQGAGRLHRWGGFFDNSVMKFQNAGSKLGDNFATQWAHLPDDIAESFKIGKDEFFTGMDVALEDIRTAITDTFTEAAESLGIPRPEWLDEFIESLKPGGSTSDSVTEMSKGDFSSIDPTVPANQEAAREQVSKLDPSGYGLTGASGGGSSVTILRRIEKLLKEEQTVKTTVLFNAKTLADIMIQLSRTGARTS